MAVNNLNNPVFHLDDPVTGGPLVGGQVFVYKAGTTTALTVYKEAGLTNAHTQPITLDSYGNAEIWYDKSAYIQVFSADGLTQYYDMDDLDPTGGTTTVVGEYNSIQNGDFEAGSGTDVTSWTLAPYDVTSVITLDTTNVRSGTTSLLFNGASGFGGGTATSTMFNVASGQYLQAQLSTMTTNTNTTNTAIIYWYQKDGSTPSATPTTILSLPSTGAYPTTMTDYSFLELVPTDATRATLVLTGVDSGGANLDSDCWFDNVSVVDRVNIGEGLAASPVGYLQANKTASGINPQLQAGGASDLGVDIVDSNGNELIKTTPVASAVNEISVKNAATGNKPSIDQTGPDDVGIDVEGVELKNGVVTGALAGNSDTATVWQTTRTTTVDGDVVTGTVNLDGSADTTLTLNRPTLVVGSTTVKYVTGTNSVSSSVATYPPAGDYFTAGASINMFKALNAGALTVSYGLINTASGFASYARILVNGTQVDEQSMTGTTRVYKTYDVNLVAGDIVVIQVRDGDGTKTATLSDIQIKASVSTMMNGII